MGRINVVKLRLKSGEEIQVPLEEGRKIRNHKGLKPMGQVVITSQDNRMVDCTYIVDIREEYVGFEDNQASFFLEEGEIPKVTKDSPGYIKFQEAKRAFMEKQKRKWENQNENTSDNNIRTNTGTEK